MKTTTVRDMQHHFKDILVWIQDGEEVHITRNGVLVARLLPPEKISKSIELPDFKARLRENFGDKVLPDSQAIFDDMRGEW